MIILAIDPGNEQSAVLRYDTATGVPDWWAYLDNEEALARVDVGRYDALAVEMIASYGMPVGREVFETCVWIGRFVQRWEHSRSLLREPSGITPTLAAEMVYRRDVKLHLCGSARAKDSNIRQALIDRYGPGKERAVGLKASPGPLYGMSGDCWAALAVAVTAAEASA